MLCLTRAEETIYNELFIGRAPNLAPGLYYIRDFFIHNPSIPRIARRFYEDVSAGRFDNIVLKAERSNEGYVVLEAMNRKKC